MQDTSIFVKKINRLKVVLVEQNKTGKWPAEILRKNEAIVSRWCTNETQPSLESLVKITEVLKVNARKLLMDTKTE